MSNFGPSLRKTVELKNHSVPNDKAPSQTEKEKFSSINLLTVIVEPQLDHTSGASDSSRPRGLETSRSLKSFLHHTPDSGFLLPSLERATTSEEQEPSLDTFQMDGWKY